MIRSRLVLNFPGFEPTAPEHQLDRILGTAQKTGEVWNFTTNRLEVRHEPGRNHAVSEWVTKGANWETKTRIVQFSWSDIISSYEKISHPKGFLTNLPKFLAFFADGTIFRYWRVSQRYFAFTVFPILLVAIFAVVSWFAASWIAGQFLTGSTAFLLSLPLALIFLLILCKWPGNRLYLLLTINDWGFARDMVNRSNPAIEARFTEFGDTLAREIEAGGYDEVIVSGHSFGSLWAIGALAKALDHMPDLLHGRNVIFLAAGSSLLKIALAPNAQYIRDWTAKVIAQDDLFWHEIQYKNDIIAFYKADPFEALGIEDIKAQVRIDRVDYKRAMEKKRFRTIRSSPYRLHRQYILNQDVRVPFDYQLKLFGPLPARDVAMQPEMVTRIDNAGTLL